MNALEELFEVLALLTMKSLLLLAAAWVISLALHRASAAIRHLGWLAAAVALLFLPIGALMLPSWTTQVEISSIAMLQNQSGSPVLAEASREPTSPESASPKAGEVTGVAEAASAFGSWRSLAVLIWAAVAAGMAIRTGTALVCLRKHGFAAREPVVGSSIAELFQSCGRSLGLRRGVTLKMSASEQAIPVTWGYFRPTVLLPRAALEWEPSRLRAVLLHELAHVARADWLVLLIAHAVRTLFWFNPGVWFMARALRCESEKAADDIVVNSGIKASAYSHELLAVLRSATQSPVQNRTHERSPHMAAAISMAQPNTVEARIRSLLDSSRSRRPLGRLHVAAAFSLAAMLAVPLATLEVRAAEGPAVLGQAAATDLPDRTSPEAAVTSFIRAFNQGDLAAMGACVIGGRAQTVQTVEKMLKDGSPNLQFKGTSTSLDGEEAVVTVASLTMVMREAGAPAVPPLKDQRLRLRKADGSWRIIPMDLTVPQGNPSSTLLEIATSFTLNDDEIVKSKTRVQRNDCMHLLRQLAITAHQFAQKHDGRLAFSPAEAIDVLSKFSGTQFRHSCQDNRQGNVQYAFNSNLANVHFSRILRPTRTVLFYEMAASGEPSLHHDGMSNVVFADGHVERVRINDLADVIWKP